MLVLVGLALTGCGGGGSETGGVSGSGGLVISLTDAEGDFATYTVDVVALTLTKANEVVVETLPLTTRVDFTRYTDLTEFLTAATVPSGVYVRGSLVLDYSNADIWVEEASGDALRVENVVDGNGDPLTQQEVSVKLEGRNQLAIVAGVPAHLTLDFDLQASNKVVFDSDGVPTVTVSPFLLAEVNADHNKPHRLRGPLKEVNTAASRFEVYLRPFRHRIVNQQHHFGTLEVFTDSETTFEIDGVGFQGEAGLAVMDLLSPYTAVTVVGDIHLNPRRFLATQVYAGSSVSGGAMDVVRGSVVARSDNSLTVKGVTLFRMDGSIVFNDTVTVQLADSTRVGKQLSIEPAAVDDVSVGQRVTVFGAISNPDVGALELDAANGYVRMELSTVQGTRVPVAGIPEQPLSLAMSITSINGRNADLYDFTGTGSDTASDADPSNYEVNTGVLDVSGIDENIPISVRKPSSTSVRFRPESTFQQQSATCCYSGGSLVQERTW
jgi:hypothetical protein